MPTIFDLQGHRGARGLCPENTLPSFELAIDLGATSIETDLHLTADDVPVLIHDSAITPILCRLLPGAIAPEPREHLLVRSLTLSQLRSYRADRNPEPLRFSQQKATATPLALAVTTAWQIDPFAIPTLAELIAFADAYQGEPGRQSGKTEEQRARARGLRFDLELKRVPARPETIGDGFDGIHPGALETKSIEIARAAGVLDRTIVRSFDHRSVRAIRSLEPNLTTAVLISGTAPIDPVHLVRAAQAQVYCPDHTFLDREQVRQCHAEGIRVVPWTVNDVHEMNRLLQWNVDGMTTDYPGRLAKLLEM